MIATIATLVTTAAFAFITLWPYFTVLFTLVTAWTYFAAFTGGYTTYCDAFV